MLTPQNKILVFNTRLHSLQYPVWWLIVPRVIWALCDIDSNTNIEMTLKMTITPKSKSKSKPASMQPGWMKTLIIACQSENWIRVNHRVLNSIIITLHIFRHYVLRSAQVHQCNHCNICLNQDYLFFHSLFEIRHINIDYFEHYVIMINFGK